MKGCPGGSGDGVAVYFTQIYVRWGWGGGGEGLKAVLNKGWSLEGVHLHQFMTIWRGVKK